MAKVGVVILNYLNYKDTIECVDSLKTDLYQNKEIIIVDNKSNNESWKILNDSYYNKEGIHLIQSEENLGFARGNNLGIMYARNKLKCDHVLVVNNDTIFIDENMIIELVKSYKEGIGIIGPDIISADNKHQNPVNKVVTKKRVKNDLQTCRNRKRSNNIVIRIKNKILSTFNTNKDSLEPIDLVLHGSCMLLTKDYFKFYPYLFPNTFLYYEEDILTLLTRKVNLSKLYVNSVHIYHKEDQSSEMSFSNEQTIKDRFLIDSIEECYYLFDMSYIEIMNKYF